MNTAIPRPTFSIARAVIATILTIALAATLSRADETTWKLLEEHWYILEIDNRTAGWTHAQVHDDGERFRNTTETVISIERAGIASNMEIRSAFVETHAGKPLRIRSERVMSQQPVEVEWRFEESGVIGVFRQGGREITREQPHPEGVWLTPRAAFRYRLERANAGAEEVTYRSIDPSSDDLRPTTTRSRRIGETEFEIDGRELPVTIWKTQTDEIAPMEATEHYTSDGHLVYQSLPIGIGDLTIRRVTREEAIAAKGAAAPELFLNLFIEPDRRVENVSQTRRMQMRLRTKTGAMPELPSTGAQRFTMSEDAPSALVVVDVDRPQEASEEDAAKEEYRTASPLVDSDDELIKALTRRALRSLDESERDDPASRAEALRVFVKRHITIKDLDTAFASASETARMRTGDCTEHAVLLAAMLRAADIPARAASGLVYVEQFRSEHGVFGWHMWTQALIGGKWIDLDSTTPEPFHAGYILTSTSGLADGGHSDLSTMLQLIGNLEIEIVSIE